MCGIAGWVSFDRNPLYDDAVLRQMTDAVACRGPDARGTWTDRYASFGHRRLAIIDKKGGGQPMLHDAVDGTIAITYCGEVYNHRELRLELRARGHRFQSDSDTEVVLRGYIEWGEQLPNRLNGMYAMAIWDSRIDMLVMIRDRVGAKPLYYARTSDGVVFGSEPKVLLANPLVARTVDLDGLRQIFAFVKAPGRTVWSAMREVLPGAMVAVSREGLRERPYWVLEAAPHVDDLATTGQKVHELLADTVRRQLIADVNCCTMLSGGLDSSAVTAMAARALPPNAGPLRTFAVRQSGALSEFVADSIRGSADAPFARTVAEHVGCHHTEVAVTPINLADPELRRAIVAARDAPSGMGDVDQSFYLLCRSIRQECAVALSGEGADELFGGYEQFLKSRLSSAPIFPWIAQYADSQSGTLTPVMTRVFARQLDILTYLRDSYVTALRAAPQLTGEESSERRMREMSYLHLTHFLPLLLERKDRLSMAVGLEVRVPFCDHRLIEYVFNVPWRLKVHDGREKALLRTAVTSLLPPAVAARKKSAYPSMKTSTYGAELRRQVVGLLDDKGHVVFDMFDRKSLLNFMATVGGAVPPGQVRIFERLLDMHAWLESSKPELRV